MSLTVVGESLVDVIVDPCNPAENNAYPGGSPFNVAIGTARLGLQTTLVTQFAKDAYGDLLQGHLASGGVMVINNDIERTSTSLATLGPDGAAEYNFSINWQLDGTALPVRSAVQASTHLHTGSIATALCPGDQATLALVQAAREHATISYDPNCRPALCHDAAATRRQAELFVAASDVVKASDEDLAWLYPHRSPEESMEAWLKLGPSAVAMTRGASGPMLLSREGRFEIAAEPISVIDTVGAGDSFMSALLAGLAQAGALGAHARPRLQSMALTEWHHLMAYANRAAAITCSRAGANPPSSTEIGAMKLIKSLD